MWRCGIGEVGWDVARRLQMHNSKGLQKGMEAERIHASK